MESTNFGVIIFEASRVEYAVGQNRGALIFHVHTSFYQNDFYKSLKDNHIVNNLHIKKVKQILLGLVYEFVITQIKKTKQKFGNKLCVLSGVF